MPRLPRETTADVAKCHACHVKVVTKVVCDKAVCVCCVCDKLCVTKLCVTKLCEDDAGEEDAGEKPGGGSKNKNPTIFCGEKLEALEALETKVY